MRLADALRLAAGNLNEALPPPEFINYAASLIQLSSTTVNIPAGTVNGDMMFLIIGKSGGATTSCTGWTPVYGSDAGAVQVYYKVANNEGTSVTFTRGNSLGAPKTVLVTYRGASTYSFTGNTSITTAVNNSLVGTFYWTKVDSTSPFFTAMSNPDLSDFTKEFDVSSTSDSGGGWALGSGVKETAGTVQKNTTTPASAYLEFRIILEP